MEIHPIGYVFNERKLVGDDRWGDIISEIKLTDVFTEKSLEGLDKFSHAEVIYHFDKVPADKIEYGSRYPRNRTEYGKYGIFAQRGKNRPNRLGATIVKIEQVNGKTLVVKGLDAIDGTPVIDIKPAMKEFLPRGEWKQPSWVSQLMADYW
ncbi:SAM-dependent methyltransferase [Thalassobacillus pellis]|uniref:SAM-dependent methyltransferase n=1 Tax=Thalassobacillus pellis TaxID=748008 RepID=UPI00195FBD36|nr:SAM-dependent methyltransferase [Thalassobacillus pellis]MBM7553741.1 tRNA-Thr(GGU) m(6)t(6)A37 methyltransferase TsaA [Thalassobacillus pellis]